MSTRKYKHLEAFKNIVISVIISETLRSKDLQVIMHKTSIGHYCNNITSY